jgi:hypothetical protein
MENPSRVRELQRSEELLEKLGLKKGCAIELTKVTIESGQTSGISTGTSIHGVLEEDVRLGRSVRVGEHFTSTALLEVFSRDDRNFFKTATSLYELTVSAPQETFHGLTLENDLGSVHLPSDARIADLGNEVVSIPLQSGSEDLSFYIDKGNLDGILLEVNGGQLFRAMQARFFVVAKVGEGHLPFYMSSNGTSGKQAGKWYPFFGYANPWIVKGSVDKATGTMTYSSAITKIQEVLDENLRFPGEYISQTGKFGPYEAGAYEPTEVLANLSTYLAYQNRIHTPFKDARDEAYVVRITGYDPHHVANDQKGSPEKWIQSIVAALG